MRFLSTAIALFLLAGCTSGGARDWKLPAEIEGGWKLSVLPPSRETFELVRRLAPKKSLMSGYEGPGKLLVSALELANGPAAFEQVQKWHAQPGKIAFHHGPWLVVLESEGLDASQLSRIASALEKTMPD